MTLAAAALLRKIRTGRDRLDLVALLLIRLGLISAVVVVAGGTRTLSAAPLGLAGAAALAVFLAARSTRDLLPSPFRGIGAWGGALAIGIGLRLLLQAWFFAPYSADVLSYHLPKVAEWIRAGGFTAELGVDDHAAFPAGFELIEAWWSVFLHHDVLIEMAGIEFLALGFAATAALAESLGLGDRACRFAATLFVLTPGIHLQATSCLNDGPVAALWVATAALASARAPWPLLFLAAGLGLGVKPTYGFALPGLAWILWAARREPPASRAVPWAAWAVGASGVGLGILWYVRALVGGFRLPSTIQAGPRLSSLASNLTQLASPRIQDQQVAYGPYLDRISGWGAVAFACGLAALVVMVRNDARGRRCAAGFGLSLGSVLLMSAPDPWSLRFVLFFPAILAIAAARFWETQRLRIWIPAVGIAVQIAGTFLPYDLPRSRFEVLVRQSWRERSTAEFFGAATTEEAVGYFADNRGSAYALYRPDFSRRVVYLRSTSPDELVRDMTRAEIRMLYAVPAGGPRQAVLEACVREGRLRSAGGRFYLRTPPG